MIREKLMQMCGVDIERERRRARAQALLEAGEACISVWKEHTATRDMTQDPYDEGAADAADDCWHAVMRLGP